jgi:hypothetical protein
MFELSSDIYFVVYKLYYVSQNDDLETHAWPINRDGGSSKWTFSLSMCIKPSTCTYL